ncbi:MAG: hypothetical protein ACR2I0_09925, partial [Rhodoferax sp.]
MKYFARLLLLCLMWLTCAGGAWATSYTWGAGSGNGSGNWDVAANWSPNGVPGSADDVTLNGGTVTLTAATTVNSLTCVAGSNINNGGYLLTVGVGSASSTSTTCAAVISGAGGLTLNLSSTSYALKLTGTNTYSGTTTISSGILYIGDGGTTGTLGSGNVID